MKYSLIALHDQTGKLLEMLTITSLYVTHTQFTLSGYPSLGMESRRTNHLETLVNDEHQHTIKAILYSFNPDSKHTFKCHIQRIESKQRIITLSLTIIPKTTLRQKINNFFRSLYPHGYQNHGKSQTSETADGEKNAHAMFETKFLGKKPQL